ncbi:nitrogen fixation protein NifZ [Methylophilus glucosoxydans]|uniref:Nitrogen fixation protein NifZ n=1 Tax=Methylophilus glucosoxydans TaxID=752553 RepID=A0ABW3GJK7_9PROT|nr:MULTISPECIES: nitrogen fixation protein NifZ [unclassified Methylophilus]MBF5038527.1 nitrogen fixation protein NifZ [Methylophilus sp. 13]MDT7848130.1 nitrogen fixation protein NifZ [Methylophilus sp. VKM B-3414]
MATNIVRDSDVVELVNPPRFDYGQKVRSKKYVRNDGTFPGKEVGEILVKKGDVGYVTSIGTFLQQFYIYGVDFYELGYRVGMRGKELEADAPEDDDEDLLADEAAQQTEEAST